MDNLQSMTLKSHLKNQLESRYHMKEMPSAKRAIISDSAIVGRWGANQYLKAGNRKVIGEFSMHGFADHNIIPFEELLRMLEIDINEVAENLQKIKDKKLHLAVVGYGGMCINTLTFMSKLVTITGVYIPFFKITLFEADNISATNAYRVYKDISSIPWLVNNRRPANKLELFREEKILARTIKKEYKFLGEEEVTALKAENTNLVLFGAPNFKTRQLLENEDFLFAGHQNNSVMLITRPHINSDITIETYGKVDIDTFFINILLNTIETIKFLASDTGFEHNSFIFNKTTEEMLEGITREEDGMLVFNNNVKLDINGEDIAIDSQGQEATND